MGLTNVFDFGDVDGVHVWAGTDAENGERCIVVGTGRADAPEQGYACDDSDRLQVAYSTDKVDYFVAFSLNGEKAKLTTAPRP